MTYRVLVVGTGSIGERHVRCMLATGRTEVGICETNDGLRKEIAERYSVIGAYGSLAEAMQERWDAAVVATPAPSHIAIGVQLADAGVNLLMEKPLALTTDGVEEFIRKVRSKELTAVMGYVWRAHPLLAGMREFLLSGKLGKPVQIVVTCGQSFPFYRPAYREVYYADRAKGGGAIQDAMTHMLNAGEWLVGPITRLVADAEHMVLEGVQVEDTVHILTRHGDVMGCYSLNQHQAPSETTISVICERGTARFEFAGQRWRWMDEPEGQWHDEVVELKDRDEWFIMQEQRFLDTLAGKAEPLCTLEEGLQTLKVNMASLHSVDRKLGWQTID